MQKIKVFMPLLLAFLSLVGTILVAVIQTRSANKDDVKASSDSVVKQLNDKTIPYLQSQFDKLDSKFDDLNVRISRLEGKLDHPTAFMMKSSPAAPMDMPKAKPSIPKLKMVE